MDNTARSQKDRTRQRRQWLRRRWQLSVGLLALSSFVALVAILLSLLFPVTETIPTTPTEPVVSASLEVQGPPAPSPSPEPVVSTPTGDLSLVNSEHSWTFPEDTDLVSVYENCLDTYYVRDLSVMLEERVMEPLNQMLADFYTATDCTDLLICAGYRTLEDQQALWDNGIETQGLEHTAAYIAQPGCSEHHTGLALDFTMYDVYSGIDYDFDGTEDSAWILENCWKYGFVQRYPEGKSQITGISTEPWHFRYVGEPHAYLMHQNDMCLEEYLEWLTEYTWDGAHLQVEYDGTNYEIWCCPESDPHYPDSGSYTVSSDNCGNVIITLVVD
jgi:D-alanyl-D-alanine carboxypeptidase